MTFYDLLSGILSVIGYTILVYRIVHLLQGHRVRRQRLERLCTKWLVFAIFLKVEDYLLVVFDIFPMGKLLLLLLKFFLFMPENSISHSIYKRIHKTLQRVKLQEYHSHTAVAISFLSTLGVNLLLRGACKLAALIDCEHIEEVERRILEIIKVLEYKRTAISMRDQASPSDANQDLNASEFNSSIAEQESPRERRRWERSEMASKMNRLLVGSEGGSVRARVEVMVTRPNKSGGKKARYSTVEACFESKGSKLTLSSRGGEEVWTLSEIRWITKNMMNIQVVFGEGGSRILRLKDPDDVVRWIEPICSSLQRIEEEEWPTSQEQLPPPPPPKENNEERVELVRTA